MTFLISGQVVAFREPEQQSFKVIRYVCGGELLVLSVSKFPIMIDDPTGIEDESWLLLPKQGLFSFARGQN